jgi:hypothetical protein
MNHGVVISSQSPVGMVFPPALFLSIPIRVFGSINGIRSPAPSKIIYVLSRPDLCPRTRICVGRAFHSSRHELESLLHSSFPYLGGRTPYSTSFLAASKSSSTPGVSHPTTLFVHRLSVPPDIDAEGESPISFHPLCCPIPDIYPTVPSQSNAHLDSVSS